MGSRQIQKKEYAKKGDDRKKKSCKEEVEKKNCRVDRTDQDQALISRDLNQRCVISTRSMEVQNLDSVN